MSKGKTDRGNIPEAWKSHILRNQKEKCARCGKKFTSKRRPIFDHKIPLAMGGSHSLRNLQALCALCNDNKTRKDKARIGKAKKSQKKKAEKSQDGWTFEGYGERLDKVWKIRS